MVYQRVRILCQADILERKNASLLVRARSKVCKSFCRVIIREKKPS